MTETQRQVVQILTTRPDTSYAEASRLIGCSPGYVRKTAMFNGCARADRIEQAYQTKLDRLLTWFLDLQRLDKFPTPNDMIAFTGHPRATVYNHLHRLQEQDLVEVYGTTRQRHRKITTYCLTPQGMRRARALSPSAAQAKTH